MFRLPFPHFAVIDNLYVFIDENFDGFSTQITIGTQKRCTDKINERKREKSFMRVELNMYERNSEFETLPHPEPTHPHKKSRFKIPRKFPTVFYQIQNLPNMQRTKQVKKTRELSAPIPTNRIFIGLNFPNFFSYLLNCFSVR